MSKVIRISDEVFRRLQRLSIPLEDTPSSVIERLLDRHERVDAVTPQPRASNAARSVGSSRSHRVEDHSMNVFLVPAHEDNLNATVLRSVPSSEVTRHLIDPVAQQVVHGLGPTIKCWGTTSGSAGEFRNMQNRDWVFLSPNATGMFRYVARVAGKVRSRALGDALWTFRNGKPWEFVYFLEDVEHIQISKAALFKEFSYSPDYHLPGLTRVRMDRVRAVSRVHGSIAAMISALDGRRG